jgi:hypothetical protein
MIINNNYEYIKNLRISSGIDKNKDEGLEKISGPESFFSLDLKDHGNRKKRKKEGEGLSFVYKFLEGVNSAVKYDVKMKEFFNE